MSTQTASVIEARSEAGVGILSGRTQSQVVELLNDSFEQAWGNVGRWRWKHLDRPGFLPEDVVLYNDGGQVIACFHAVHSSVRLSGDTAISRVLLVDFAIRQSHRGTGLLERGVLETMQRAAERGAVICAGYTSRVLFERVYSKKFGHCAFDGPGVRYRKILSDRMLREKLRHIGEGIRGSPWIRVWLRQQTLAIRFQIDSFQPCCLKLTTDSATCDPDTGQPIDVALVIPLPLLASLRQNGLRALASPGSAVRYLAACRCYSLAPFVLRWIKHMLRGLFVRRL